MRGSGAAELLKRVGQPRQVRLFAVDDVLVRVVGVVVADVGGDGLVALEQREPLAVALLQKGDEFGGFHDFCFSLQLMQTRVHGMAWSRASAIGSPQSRQMP